MTPSLKYHCRICGFEGEGRSLPTDDCPCCGAAGEWEKERFDARCARCGQGYYESSKPNSCPHCGMSLVAPVPPPRPSVTTRKRDTSKSPPKISISPSPGRKPFPAYSTPHPPRGKRHPFPSPRSSKWKAWGAGMLVGLMEGVIVLGVVCLLGYFVLPWGLEHLEPGLVSCWDYLCSFCSGAFGFLSFLFIGIWDFLCLVLSWGWAILCFMFRHWILSLIVLWWIVGGNSKS